MDDDEYRAIIIPSSLEDNPLALYLAILKSCPDHWMPQDVVEMYESIMEECEEIEEEEKPKLNIVKFDDEDTH